LQRSVVFTAGALTIKMHNEYMKRAYPDNANRVLTSKDLAGLAGMKKLNG